MDIKEIVTNSAAWMIWALSFADHCEEHKCRSLSGCKLDNLLPKKDIPYNCYKLAEYLIEKLEKANGASIAWIFGKAMMVELRNGKENFEQKTVEEFGGDLVHMCVGTGISWFDDHAEIPLKTIDLDLSVIDSDMLCKSV